MSRSAALRQLPLVRPLLKARFERRFQTPAGIGCLCGEYPSFAAATAAAPPSLPIGYDVPATGALYRDRMERVLLKDYPALFWLSRALPGARRLFDLGGHVGLMYYAYGRYLTPSSGLAWTVCDVPAVVEAGKKIAVEKGATTLHFTSEPRDVDGADVLLATGSLQYIERPLHELLASLATKPRHVLVNETPTHRTREIITLQNIGVSICPYRIAHRDAFAASVTALGYTLVDSWDDPARQTEIPYLTAQGEIAYSGFYFRAD